MGLQGGTCVPGTGTRVQVYVPMTEASRRLVGTSILGIVLCVVGVVPTCHGHTGTGRSYRSKQRRARLQFWYRPENIE